LLPDLFNCICLLKNYSVLSVVLPTQMLKCKSLRHVNCRSLSKNYTNLTILLKQLQCPIPFIALSEIWTTLLSENNFHLPGYNFVATSRINKSGGGVENYIAENIAFKLRDDLRLSSDNVYECIFIESLADNILIGCVCKPPDSDVSSFTSEFDNLLTAINKRKQTCYIAGDLNIDLLKCDRHVATCNFVNCT